MQKAKIDYVYKFIDLTGKVKYENITDYKTYDDLYTDGHTYILSKSIAVASGYQYRVTCTHYAKKNLFSTQKINNVSNVVTI